MKARKSKPELVRYAVIYTSESGRFTTADVCEGYARATRLYTETSHLCLAGPRFLLGYTKDGKAYLLQSTARRI